MLNDDFQDEGKIEAPGDEDESLDLVDELLRDSADRRCGELDDPEELRRWFDRIVEIIEQRERGGSDELLGESTEDGMNLA